MLRARWALAMTGWVDEARARSIMGPPPEPSVSGSGGGRRRSAMNELSPQGEARDMELVSTMSRLAPSATVPKPCDCTESPDRARWPRLGFLLRSGLSHLLPGTQRFSVTLRALRDGTLLTTPPEMPRPPAACFPACVVRCVPAPGRSALLCHASPVRDARLPSDSGQTRAGPRPAPGLCPSAPVHPGCSRRLSASFRTPSWHRSPGLRRRTPRSPPPPGSPAKRAGR